MEDYTISKFDRSYSGLIDGNAVMTRATTIEYVQKVTVEAETQREALTARRRSIASKLTAQARKDRGELPGFMRGGRP